jgi:hypothetical protein
MPILKFLFFMLCAPPLWAVPYGPVIDDMTPGSITIIDESHGRVESVELFQSLALAAADRYRCVIVGLEIASDQQPLKQQGLCIEVVAIDASMDNKVDRDQWMALRLTEQAGDAPVLVLLGSLHTLKKIDWMVAAGKPRVAEILSDKGFRVRSFPQRWIPDQCSDNNGRMSRFVSAYSTEALTILNDSLVSLLNANPHASAHGVVDGFILWECSNTSRF